MEVLWCVSSACGLTTGSDGNHRWTSEKYCQNQNLMDSFLSSVVVLKLNNQTGRNASKKRKHTWARDRPTTQNEIVLTKIWQRFLFDSLKWHNCLNLNYQTWSMSLMTKGGIGSENALTGHFGKQLVSFWPILPTNNFVSSNYYMKYYIMLPNCFYNRLPLLIHGFGRDVLQTDNDNLCHCTLIISNQISKNCDHSKIVKTILIIKWGDGNDVDDISGLVVSNTIRFPYTGWRTPADLRHSCWLLWL